LPLSATQPLSHRILTNKNRKRHIPYAYMNNIDVSFAQCRHAESYRSRRIFAEIRA
jgi:hypothetical protein